MFLSHNGNPNELSPTFNCHPLLFLRWKRANQQTLQKQIQCSIVSRASLLTCHRKGCWKGKAASHPRSFKPRPQVCLDLAIKTTISAQASDKATSNPANSLRALPLISQHSISPRIFQQAPVCQKKTSTWKQNMSPLRSQHHQTHPKAPRRGGMRLLRTPPHTPTPAPPRSAASPPHSLPSEVHTDESLQLAL